MKSSVRVACIGAGGNTRAKHIPGFQALEGVEVLGVVNRSRESSQAVADTFGIPRVYDHWEEVMSDPEVDAVCIGTWPYMHCPVTLAALDAGKHVLCEARMAMNADEAQQMMTASIQHPQLITQLVPAPFMLGPDAAILEVLEKGELGEILAADLTVRSRAFPDWDAPKTWRQDRALSGLNVLMMGIYYEAAMRWMGRVKTVQASGHITVTERPGQTGELEPVDILDHVDMCGSLVNGATYRMSFSAVTGFGPENACWIYGTEGVLKVDFATRNVFLGRKGESELRNITPPDGNGGGWRVEAEFVGAIRGEEPVKYTTFEEGLHYMQFTQAVEDSRVKGERITLPG